MSDPLDTRVAVYIDFDNIVISRYSQLHGRRSQEGKMRDFAVPNPDPGIAARLREATVDIGAILDFATSFGNVVISRAYADWSVPVNASYRNQLIGRAVDLTQMFPTTQSMKNGADIRLAVDVVEDLFRLPDITHVVIVAGDSDYIALAQRCKRLGRYVVGIGVAGSTSTSLADACDEFQSYDELPGLDDDTEELLEAALAPVATPVASTGTTAGTPPAAAAPSATSPFSEPVMLSTPAAKTATGAPESTSAGLSQKAATQLFMRALRLVHAKDDDVDWLPSTTVKNQMLRINPSFSEKALGFRSFSDFVKDRQSIAELKEDGQQRHIRLRPSYLKD
jgi:uncharacterized LabA/DUF88 family protein